MNQALNYQYPSPNPSWWQSLRNRFAGWRDCKGVLKQFLKDNNLTAVEFQSGAVTAKKYFLKTQYMEILADKRDRGILREVAKVRKLQNSLEQDGAYFRTSLQSAKDKLASLKKEQTDVKQALKNTSLTSLQKAHLQGDLGTLDASIINQQNQVAGFDHEVKVHDTTYRENLKTFDKFLKDIDNMYGLVLNDYIKSAGRQLHNIGFTNFDGELRDHNDHTTKQIEELKHGL